MGERRRGARVVAAGERLLARREDRVASKETNGARCLEHSAERRRALERAVGRGQQSQKGGCSQGRGRSHDGREQSSENGH